MLLNVETFFRLTGRYMSKISYSEIDSFEYGDDRGFYPADIYDKLLIRSGLSACDAAMD